MFFFGVFGIESKEAEIRDIQNKICKSCNSITSYKLIKTYNLFHFFFIPVLKWGIRYYLISRCCNNVFEIPNDIGKDLEDGNNVEIRDEDMHLLYQNYPYDNIVCPSCRNHLDAHYSFCPYCGTKIRQ